jgi:hypothetical protein
MLGTVDPIALTKKGYLTREKSCAKKLNQGGDPLWLLTSFLFW